jgi:DNA polymerase III psi subunit
VKDDQHLTLTTEQIKRMPWQQHARIWKVHTCCQHPCMRACGQPFGLADAHIMAALAAVASIEGRLAHLLCGQ